MVAYGIDDARAFEVLKLSSQLAQVKLATVARQFLDAIRSHGLPPETVRTIDRLLVQTRQSHQNKPRWRLVRVPAHSRLAGWETSLIPQSEN